VRAGNDNGHVGSMELGLVQDTGKAGLWPGGFLNVRAEGRLSDGILARAGTITPVTNDAIFPNVPGRLGEDVFALNELSYMQFFSEQFGVILGLINTDTGDSNPIAGFIGSDEYFLNTGFLYSSVTAALAPTATLGGGLIYIHDEQNQFSFLVIGTSETAGFNPFDLYGGTTFIGEWNTTYEAFDKPGGMTLAGYYGVDHSRFTAVTDNRILIASALTGQQLRSGDTTWAISWNGYQYFQGDENQGWGIFGRFGLADGNPNINRWNAAAGFGGVGLFPCRPADRWGIGVFHQDFTDTGLLPFLGIDDETGGEVFYNLSLCPGIDLTLDLQVVDSALPGVDNVVVGGARIRMDW
ncbi:MAG: carbohydrate porin, partial [Verrucomicrobiota bacterium]